MIKKMLVLILATAVSSQVFADEESDAQREALRRQADVRAATKALRESEIEMANCAPKPQPNEDASCPAARSRYVMFKQNLDQANDAVSQAGSVTAERRISSDEVGRACDKKAEEFKAGLTINETALKSDGMGTNALRECVVLSKGHLRSMFRSGQRVGAPHTWMELLQKSDKCVEFALKECKKSASQDSPATQDSPSQKAEYYIKKFALQCSDSSKELVARCDGAAYLISTFGRDWTNPEHVRNETVKGGNPVAITCQGAGVSTFDYDGCVKFVQNGDIMDAAQGAIQQGQDLYYKDKAMTAQMEAASSTESATANLKAMGTGIKGQQEIMQQRAALETGKFAALATYYSEIPTYEDLSSKCNGYKATGPEGMENGCELAKTNQKDFGFLMNQTSKEKMKAKLAKVGIDVASNVVMAGLLGRRLNDVNNAITQVDAFKPIDPLAPAADNAQSTYCQQNPGDAKCLTGGLDRTFDAFSDNVITFGEGGTGASFSNSNPFIDPTAGTIDSTTPGSKNNIASVGSVITGAQQNGGLETKGAAATVSKGAAPTAGGGGGGSGGGVGGGGGGGTPGALAQGGTAAAVQGRTPTYGGGTGTLSMMGGYGINKNKGSGKEEGNPFGKLFNKDGNKSGVINFAGRTPASVGNKGDNLFDMISKRYTSVNGDKRLLEYEQVNK